MTWWRTVHCLWRSWWTSPVLKKPTWIAVRKMITLSIVKNTIPAEQRRAGMFFQRAEGKRTLEVSETVRILIMDRPHTLWSTDMWLAFRNLLYNLSFSFTCLRLWRLSDGCISLKLHANHCSIAVNAPMLCLHNLWRPCKILKKFKLTLYSSWKASFLLVLLISLTAVKM